MTYSPNPLPHRPRSRRGARFTFAALTAALLGGGVAITIATRAGSSLKQRAELVADVSDWWTNDLGTQDYVWLSDTRLFVAAGRWRLNKPFLLDTKTGSRTELSGLQAQLGADADVDDWTLSPNGQWILWHNEFGGETHVARLDGSHFQTITAPDRGLQYSGLRWRDNHRWSANSVTDPGGSFRGVIGGDVDRPGDRETLPLSEHFDADLEVDPRGAFVSIRTSARHGGARSECHEVVVNAPAGTRLLQAALSNDGSRLAWFVVADRPKPLARWIGRVWPKYAVRGTVIQLWTGPADRVAQDEVRECEVDAPVDETAEPSGMKWLPSNRRISFVLDGKLWTVPAR